jgi:hypothetical protein
MFDPENINGILSLNDHDLLLLPNSEDDRFEYKSSQTPDSELIGKIARAASGFWNSGGGLLIVGVDKQGKPDGGITLNVNRQARRDWTDQAIAQVMPRSKYAIQFIENQSAGLSIDPGKVVMLVGFAYSEIGPHMAPDKKYYIRSGAHTDPATHFLVEAIHSRRGLRKPLLKHIVRRKPGGRGVLQVGITCLNEAPALNVQINLNPLPPNLSNWGTRLPLVVPVISSELPYFFDFHLLLSGKDPRPVFTMNISYRDLTESEYFLQLEVDVDKQLGPDFWQWHYSQ